jgi:hypothetical protein
MPVRCKYLRHNFAKFDADSAIHFPSGNAKWPFSLSHNRLQTGGWARQQNGQCTEFPSLEPITDEILPVAVLPMATEMAGVNMRLEVGAVRSVGS